MNLYLHPASHHRPANKQVALATLVQRVRSLCDKDSSTHELTTTFKKNEYSHQKIRRAISPSPQTSKTIKDPPWLHFCLMSSQHMVNLPKCWLNTTSRALPYLQGKPPAIFDLRKTLWD
jgi:hypothetical protein